MGIRSTTWKYMRRSPFQAGAAVLTMFLTFLLGGFFFLTSATSSMILSYFESKPQITVFFADTATKEDADTLSATIQATGKIASVKYVSKDEALGIYREQNKNDPLLLEMVTADILPASLEVSPIDPKFLAELEPLIKESNVVEDVVYQRDVVESLIAWTNAVRVIGIGLGGLLAFDSLLIVITVIGMKIALRKREVEILKLVGGSPWYIRMPFILEGALYGVIGAFCAWIILTALVFFARGTILSFLGMIPSIEALLSHPEQPMFLLAAFGFLGMLSVGGFLLGSIGSLISVGRYLRFK